jgi:PilZ domain
MTQNQNRSGRERRRSPRVWLRRGGQLILVKGLRGTATVPCRVLNTSKDGALLKVQGAAADIPDDFYLTIAGHVDQRIICSVVRRGKQVLGVRFIAQPDYNVRTSTSFT